MPYRVRKKGKQVDVLLVTSRETKRWVVPKGNLDAKMSPHAGAADEAAEEAGVRGRISKSPIGRYVYLKRLASGREVKTKVVLFPLRVEIELDEYKEKAERERCWFPAATAASLVDEPDLAKLIAGFRPVEK
nr:NUDIX domain-containing protein [Sphingomonas mesophila]